jgi:hypothetical protein
MSIPPAGTSGDASALAASLAMLGLSCRVEPREGLAVIKAEAGAAAALAAPALRRDVLALAREHGFTHVAVELTADPAGTGASVLRP